MFQGRRVSLQNLLAGFDSLGLRQGETNMKQTGWEETPHKKKRQVRKKYKVMWRNKVKIKHQQPKWEPSFHSYKTLKAAEQAVKDLNQKSQWFEYKLMEGDDK